ncbi:MAG TPA: hypothetical protein VGA61_08660, partial [Anaerolineae bacterium]
LRRSNGRVARCRQPELWLANVDQWHGAPSSLFHDTKRGIVCALIDDKHFSRQYFAREQSIKAPGKTVGPVQRCDGCCDSL